MLFFGLMASVMLVFSNVAYAQMGERYLQPVFDEVTTTSAIPFSSAVREGATTPTTLYLDFYEPAGDTLSARPLVITVFGGAFVAGSRDFVDMVAYCTRLAQHGYAAASIDYRLLSFFQISSSALIRDAYMAAQDVSSAIRYFKAHSEEYRVDTDRIYLLGNSAGSIAILAEIFMDEDERPAETFTDPDLGPIHSSGFTEYAGLSPQVAGAVAQWGGVMDLDIIDTEEYVPLCMIHGTDDTTVPYDSGYCFASLGLSFMPYMYGSSAVAARLESLGIEDFEFHPFEGEEHAFYMPSLSYQLDEEKFGACFDIVRDFLWLHLGFPTHVPEALSRDVIVYPNPATATLVLEDGSFGLPYRLTVYDVFGREQWAEEVHDWRHSVDVSRWPSGVYVIRLETNGRCVVKKFVKRQ